MRKRGLSVVAMLSTLPVILSPVLAHAATNTKTYEVRPGNCLYDIASSFHISVSSLEKANPKVHNGLIYPGEILSIPGNGPSGSQVKTPVNHYTTGSGTYKVKPGNSMYGIASSYHISLSSLEKANPKVHNNLIYPGEMLSIPGKVTPGSQVKKVTPGSQVKKVTASRPRTSVTHYTTDARTYQVKPGNSLYEIANSFHISLSSLEEANPKVHNGLIYPGETIAIPSTTTASRTVPASVKTSPASSQSLAQEVLQTAYHLEGIHYHWGGASPATGFDCSGFVQYVFATHGIHLPRTASEQAQVGRPVPLSQLQPGDLLFFVNTYSYPTKQVTHVAIYIGNGNVIESSSVRNQGVMVIHNIMQDPWYRSRYYGARNVVGS
ncbi:C40 family peptidase [Alicyclobacillus sp. ALC3]|uniref:C40 family peptidase n=1 Tax=Alicyclobacillus sp. ALC3 TaxID=2796143 RepID=UPI0023788E97|nr:LysM peptidoglycan-binding domain-containing protein [Alicyclobacillus sp. ALC3]WDL95491.1 LysM peptidoglycan-binding domain-containing protein [Alicyclobacillus sp. ALC3]